MLRIINVADLGDIKVQNFPFEVVISNFEENLKKTDFEQPYDYVMETAKQKALAITKLPASDKKPIDLIVAADTVVYMNDKIFEKPKNIADAIEMLTLFNGATHTVYTGVALLNRTETCDYDMQTFYEGTKVRMAKLTREIIEAYVATGEPMDKAGGYGIQKLGSSLIEGVEGDFYNVEGFPLHRFCTHIVNLFK